MENIFNKNKEAAEKESLFELLFMENTNPIFIGDEKGKVIAVNNEAVKLTQYSENEILAMEKIDFLFPEEELAKKPLQYNSLYERKVVYRERKLKRKDGSLVWVSMKSKQLSNGNLISIMTDISDKKKYEELANETTISLMSLMDSNLRDIIYFKDAEGRWLKANKICLELFDLQDPDYIGRTNTELCELSYYFKKVFEELQKDDEEAWERGKLSRKETEINLSEDEILIFDITRIPIFNKDGSRKGLTVFGRDITEEQKHIKELKIKEEMYRTVVENAHEAIVITRNGIIEYVNPIVEQITGFTADELIYNSFVDFIHEDDRKRLIDYHFRRLEGEEGLPELYEFRLISKSGELIWLELKPVVIEWDGAPAGMSFIRDITEEKRMTEELIENEEKFRSIVQSMEDGIITANRDGRILFASKNFIEEKGYKVEDLIGNNILDFVYMDDRSFAFRKWLDLLEGKNEPVEFRLLKKNGEPFWIRSRSSLVVKNKEIISVTSVLIDIQERKDIEDKLRKSEIKFRRVIENAPVGITILTDNEIAFINPQLVQIMEYSDFKELLNKNILDYVSSESRKALSEYIQELYRFSKEKKSIEIKFLTKNGNEVDCLVLGQKTEFRDEESIQLYIYDITEKKKADKIVTQLTRAVEQTSTMIYITDINGRIEYVNQAILTETGYSEKEMLGKKPNLLKSGKTRQDIYRDLWNTILSGDDWSGEVINKRKDGTTYWVSLTISPVKNNDGKIINFVALSENISKQKEIEKNLKLAKEKAELSDKLKTDFIAQVSHELRTPINSILNFSNLLKKEFLSPTSNMEDMFDYLSYIENGSRRLVRTVELFLNMADVQSGSFEPHYRKFDLKEEILSTHLDDHKHHAYSKNIEFKLNIKTDNMIVIADSFSLTHILDHIIDNAIKYTKKGQININVFRNKDDKLIVEIKDTGIGIEKDYLPKIFDLFTQEDSGYTRKFDGNGLGLTLTKYYCDINNIGIEIQSEKNVGTLVTLLFN